MSPTSAIKVDHEWDGVERRRAQRKIVSEEVLLSLFCQPNSDYPSTTSEPHLRAVWSGVTATGAEWNSGHKGREAYVALRAPSLALPGTGR
jgi:hypothetical protein